jgi:uncharacterized protein with HEPN domain
MDDGVLLLGANRFTEREDGSVLVVLSMRRRSGDRVHYMRHAMSHRMIDGEWVLLGYSFSQSWADPLCDESLQVRTCELVYHGMLMTNRDPVFLERMLSAMAVIAAEFEGLGVDDFDAGWIAPFRVLQHLDLLGEAAKQVSAPLVDAHPAIPWADMVWFHDALRGGVPDLADRDTWVAATSITPELIREVEGTLGEIAGLDASDRWGDMENRPKCEMDQIVTWWKEHPDRIPRNLGELAQFPMQFRRALYNVIEPKLRAQFRTEHLQGQLDTDSGLTEEQRDFIRPPIHGNSTTA